MHAIHGNLPLLSCLLSPLHTKLQQSPCDAAVSSSLVCDTDPDVASMPRVQYPKTVMHGMIMLIRSLIARLLTTRLPLLQDTTSVNIAQGLQGLAAFLAQPNAISTSTSVTKLLAHVVVMLCMHATSPDCSTKDTSDMRPSAPIGHGLANSSLLSEDRLRTWAITDVAEVPESQMEVLSQTAGLGQQQHKQLDSQTCNLLVHDVLEPLAKAGPFEHLLCHHAIQGLLLDLGAAKCSVDEVLSRTGDHK